MQTCGNTSLSLRLSSDFLVSTKWKAIFAVASFRNSSAQFFLSLHGVLAFSKLCNSLVDMQFYFSLLETVLQ